LYEPYDPTCRIEEFGFVSAGLNRNSLVEELTNKPVELGLSPRGHGMDIDERVQRFYDKLAKIEAEQKEPSFVEDGDRRVFFVDVGDMDKEEAKKIIERDLEEKKAEMETVDFTCTFGQGCGSKVETLPGGQGLGELDDLEYFQKQLYKGLRLPTISIGMSDIKMKDDGSIDFPSCGDVSVSVNKATFEVSKVDLDTMTLDVMDEIQREFGRKIAEEYDKKCMTVMHQPAPEEPAEQLEFTLEDLDINWDAVADILDEDVIRSKPLFDEE